jgi:hypothetical protein
MFKTVTLSDGDPCEVRVLGLYELDSVPFDDPGEFEYDYQISESQVTKKRYTLRDWDEVPKEPTKPKESCETDSYEWAMWNAYDLYQAVLQRHYEQIKASEAHAHDVGRYVIRECLAESDRGRVLTPGDLDLICAAAMVDGETMGGIEAALASTFPGLLGWSLDFAGDGGAASGRG